MSAIVLQFMLPCVFSKEVFIFIVFTVGTNKALQQYIYVVLFYWCGDSALNLQGLLLVPDSTIGYTYLSALLSALYTQHTSRWHPQERQNSVF